MLLQTSFFKLIFKTTGTSYVLTLRKQTHKNKTAPIMAAIITPCISSS